MKILTLIIICVSILSQNNSEGQESIESIKMKAEQIKGKNVTEQFEQDEVQTKRLTSILRTDVISYFNLDDSLKSDLRKKSYMNTENYKSKAKVLNLEKAKLLKKTFFLDIEPTFYERNNLLQYNLELKGFTVLNRVYSSVKKTKSTIQFDHYVFSPIKDVSINYSDVYLGGMNYSQGNILLKVLDESIALKMEEGKEHLKMLFLFSLVDTSEFINSVMFDIHYKDYLINCRVKNVFIYNSETGEIYNEYKPL